MVWVSSLLWLDEKMAVCQSAALRMVCFVSIIVWIGLDFNCLF